VSLGLGEQQHLVSQLLELADPTASFFLVPTSPDIFS
jgi:hypothetical protein